MVAEHAYHSVEVVDDQIQIAVTIEIAEPGAKTYAHIIKTPRAADIFEPQLSQVSKCQIGLGQWRLFIPEGVKRIGVLRPEFQGLGFGRRLFTAARRDLAQSGLKSLIVWALSENDTAVEFYRALSGKTVARSSEKFGTRVLDKVAFGWNS